MKWYLQSARYDLWSSIVNGYIPPKKVKSITQKEARSYNSKDKDIIIDGLLICVKGRVGQCVSTKEIGTK